MEYSAVAIIISALIGATIAIVVVSSNKIAAKKKAAIDMLLTLRIDGDFLSNQQIFRKAESKHELLGILNPSTEDDFKNKLAIQNYLNIYELISVAVRQEAIDESVCQKLMGDTLVRRWNEAKELIEEIRKKDTSNTTEVFFSEFQLVAETWGKKEKIVNHHSMIGTIKDVLFHHKQ
ncbi:MAG: DUF4760 domain-containing protein [Methylococcales bacterium]